MSTSDTAETRPRVLFVYYTHTRQAQRVAEVMADVLRGRGCDVTQAGIEFTDPKYAKNFKTFPFKHAVFGILPLAWPSCARRPGRSGSRTLRTEATTTWSASAPRRGSSGPACRCAHT